MGSVNRSDDGNNGADDQKLSSWLDSQNLRAIRKEDAKSKTHLVRDFSYVLSRGIYAKQHVIGEDNAFQIHLRLDQSGILTGSRLSWVGGVECSYTNSRSVGISDITLVSTGIGTATFNRCKSADLAKPNCCLSLVLPRSLFFDEPQSIDLEFSTAEEVQLSFFRSFCVFS
jgi:hypothetical protein